MAFKLGVTMRMHFLQKVAAIFFTAWLVGCSSTPKMGTEDLAQLKSLESTGSSAPKVSALRVQSLQDAAMSLGAQSGLAWRANQITLLVQAKSKFLDQAFNFNGLMLGEHVMPPVLIMTNKSIKLDSVDTIRLSDQTYKIISQAKFVSLAPTWRDYLAMNYMFPPVPSDNMLPHNAIEQQLWQDAVAVGWQQGIEQGDRILTDNLARLTRDLKGMALYRKLLDQGMVSKPYVATSAMGITGDGDEMTINDQVMRITALPQLQPSPKGWHPIVLTDTLPTQDFNDDG